MHNGIDPVGVFEVGASAVALGIAHTCHQAANDLDRQANTYLAERLRRGVIPPEV